MWERGAPRALKLAISECDLGARHTPHTDAQCNSMRRSRVPPPPPRTTPQIEALRRAQPHSPDASLTPTRQALLAATVPAYCAAQLVDLQHLPHLATRGWGARLLRPRGVGDVDIVAAARSCRLGAARGARGTGGAVGAIDTVGAADTGQRLCREEHSMGGGCKPTFRMRVRVRVRVCSRPPPRLLACKRLVCLFELREGRLLFLGRGRPVGPLAQPRDDRHRLGQARLSKESRALR
eukprot:scaffold18199_cov69-Phaeocystis_antarctica.AAC.3